MHNASISSIYKKVLTVHPKWHHSVRYLINFSNKLNPKSTGLFYPGAVCPPPPPPCKIRSRHSRELKLTRLIGYIMFYKICKFRNSTITNDVIMTSVPKTIAKLRHPRNQTNYISFKRY